MLSLPKGIGETTTVTLETLQHKKYIGEVVDRNKNKCNVKESTVTIFKYSKTAKEIMLTAVVTAPKKR